MVSALSLLALRALASDPGLPIFVPEQAASHAVFVGAAILDAPDPRVRWEEGGLTFLDVPLEGAKPDFGYLATRYAVRNYRLALEYRWGAKRFPPRENALRDSGLLYHVAPREGVWPDCVEFQIQEGETGDAFLLQGGMRADGRSKDGKTFDPAAPVRPVEGGLFRRAKTADTLAGWNRVELTARGSDATYRVNGQATSALANLRHPDGSPMTEGRIALQLEGAEIRYQDVRLTPLSWPADHRPFRVLVFSKTAGFRHDSIPAGVAAIQALGKAFGFGVEATEDASAFTPERLRGFGAVVFLNTTGDVLDAAQQTAFEGYVRGGGGFVGVHSATDTEYGWPWYGRLVGATFAAHPAPQKARLRLRKDDAGSTASLPHAWERTDEWYNFRAQPEGVEVLVELDEASYQGGTMGTHPVSWQHAFEGGRAWYTALGHTKEGYADPLFLLHLLGGIGYAARIAI